MPWPTRRSIVPTVAAAVAALTLTGCGSDSTGAGQAATTPTAAEATATKEPGLTAETQSPATPATAAATPAQADAKTITVRVADGKVTPKTGRVSVDRGTRVRLVVTSDVADEIHVHSYNRELRLSPGKPAVLEFTADQTGLFEVETHETKLILLQLLVR